MLEEKLPDTLIYHSKEHTFDVLKSALEIAETEKISAAETKLLRIAVLLHDAGFIYVYKDHEEKSCEMAHAHLPGFDFSKEQISLICDIIRATKIPQLPKTVMEKIMADADLDYLGREDVFPIAQMLFEEMKLYNLMPDETNWIPFQVKFLEEHQYFTDFSRKHRGPGKDAYLKKMREKLSPQL